MVQTWRQGVEFVIVCVSASTICAVTIGWGVEWLGFLPFTVLAPAVFMNNMVMGLLLGPPLLAFLYPRVKTWGLRYQDLSGHESPGPHVEQVLSSNGDDLRQDSRPTTGDDDPKIEFLDVSFQYAQAPHPTLRNLSLSVREGAVSCRHGTKWVRQVNSLLYVKRADSTILEGGIVGIHPHRCPEYSGPSRLETCRSGGNRVPGF